MGDPIKKVNHIPRNEGIRQFIRYAIVGVINTCLYYVLYVLFLQFGMVFGIAHTIATIISIGNSYLWNKYFTFKAKGRSYEQVLKFLIVCGIQYLVSLFVIYIGITVIGLTEEIAGLPPIILSLIIGYFGNRYFSFKYKH